MNLSNLKSKIDKIAREVVELQDGVNEYAARATTYENLKEATRERVWALNAKKRENMISAQELEEYTRLQEWLQAAQGFVPTVESSIDRGALEAARLGDKPRFYAGQKDEEVE